MKWQKRSGLALMPKRESTSSPFSPRMAAYSGLMRGANFFSVSAVSITAGRGTGAGAGSAVGRGTGAGEGTGAGRRLSRWCWLREPERRRGRDGRLGGRHRRAFLAADGARRDDHGRRGGTGRAEHAKAARGINGG